MDNAILSEMWKRKANHKEVFAIGTLNKDAIAIEYDHGNYDVEGKKRTIKAGTLVLITMISRFGDVGIRDYDLTYYDHGYISRVDPSDIDNVEFVATSSDLGK